MARKKTLEVFARIRDFVSGPLRGITNSIAKFGRSVNQNFARITSTVFSLRNAIAGIVAGRALKGFANAAGAVEQWRIQLQALLKDQAKADEVLSRIRQFAADSPLMTQDVIDSFIQLRAVGIESAEETVKKIGNVALIFGRDMQDVAGAFIGLQRRTLRRLGIDISRAGKTATIVSGKMRVDVENTSDAIRKSLIEIWEKRFPDAMALAGSTFKARVAILKSQWFELIADMGMQWIDLFKIAIDNQAKFIKDNRQQWIAWARVIPAIVNRVVQFIQDIFADPEKVFNFNTLLDTWSAFAKGIVNLFRNTLANMIQLVRDMAPFMWKPILSSFLTILLQIGKFFQEKMNEMLNGIRSLGKKIGLDIPKIQFDTSEVDLAVKRLQKSLEVPPAVLEQGQKRLQEALTRTKTQLTKDLAILKTTGSDLIGALGISKLITDLDAMIARSEAKTADIERRRKAAAVGTSAEEGISALEKEERTLQERITALQLDGLNRRGAVLRVAMAKQGAEREAFLKDLVKFEENTTQRRLAITSTFFGAAAKLAQAGGEKTFEVGKKIAFAGAVVDGIAAIQKAVANPPGWPFNAGQVAAVSAFQAANVAAIAASTFGGGGGGKSPSISAGGGGGGGGGGGIGFAPETPEAGPLPPSEINLRLDGLAVVKDEDELARLVSELTLRGLGQSSRFQINFQPGS